MDFDFLNTSRCSFEDLNHHLDGNSQRAADPIETASIDQLRCWLLELGYTDREINSLKQSNMTVREIARAAQDGGYTFTALEYN